MATEIKMPQLGLTMEEINANKRLLRGLQKATKEYLKHCEDY